MISWLIYIFISYILSWVMMCQIAKRLSPDGFELIIWLLSPFTWPITVVMFLIITRHFTQFSRWFFRKK